MSLPPPVLPPQVAARTRIKALGVDLAQQTNPKLRAAIAYEIGALTESRLGDVEQALEHYREASSADPMFRPALFAQRRLLAASRDYDELVRVLARTVHASTTPADRASALVDLGCLLEDQLADPAGGKSAFERALAAQPECLEAAIMLERSLLAQNHLSEAQAISAQRTSHTRDPRLRAVLAGEAALALAARGEVDAAIETLLSALALPGPQLSTLLALSQLARRYERPAIAARACEDLGALFAAFASAPRGSEPNDLSVRCPDAASAAQAAAFFYREAGRLHASLPDHERDAVQAYERAVACLRDDVLLGLERVAACDAADDVAGARAGLLDLLPKADPRRAAALQFELAELAERQGDSDEALTRLRAAHALAPDTSVVSAVLEDRLLDRRDYNALCDLLVERAGRLQDDDRRCALLRAAFCADRAGDAARALALYDAVAPLLADPTGLLREQFGAAQRFGRCRASRAAGARLLECDIDHAERSAVLHACYQAALAEEDVPGALATLRRALAEPACEQWAPHSAWSLAALHKDDELLALAHHALAELAESAEDAELAAAHLAAESRARVRLGDDALAIDQLRRALALVPTQAYAVALLEERLVARGEATEAVHLLLESASIERDAQGSEQALLRAAVAAEQAGQIDLARSSYADAVQRDPHGFAPLWALLRFAERHADATLRLASLRALAERESALERPGGAQLELAEALCARGEWSASVPLLTAALSHDASAFEAAASSALLPQQAGADGLRPRALSLLAEQCTRTARRALEHERVAELLLETPEHARTLLEAQAARQPGEPGAALLRWLLSGADGRPDAFENLAALSDEPSERAEFVLHGLRMHAALNERDDGDALVSALGLMEEAPGSLAAALALDEALSAVDDAETRAAGLRGLLEHVEPSGAEGLRSALARTLLEAGHPERAVELAGQLSAQDPQDLSAWETLRLAARETGDWERVVQACGKLADAATGKQRALLLEEAAALLHEQLDRPEEAEPRLRSALRARPDSQPAFERLHDVLVEQHDLAGLDELLAQRIAIGGPAEQRDLLYERARILRGRGDRTGALACCDELFALAPKHPGALGLCSEIHASREDFSKAVAALRLLAEAEIPPGQKRLAREGAADFLDDKLHDPRAAYNELKPLLDSEQSDLGLHVRMADLAQRAGLMAEAAAALLRAAAATRGTQQAGFERRAATLQLEALGQPLLAAETLRRALFAHPTDRDAFASLHAILGAGEERNSLVGLFLDAVWAALSREPSDPEHLRALRTFGNVTGQPSYEQIGLFALDALGSSTAEESVAADALRARLPAQPSGALDDARFELLVPQVLRGPAGRFARAACAASWALEQDTPERHGVDRRARISKRTPSPLLEALQGWLGAFGLELSELYRGGSEQRVLYPIGSPGRRHAWIAGRDIETPLSTRTRLEFAPFAAAARADVLPLTGDTARGRDLLRLAFAAAGGRPLPSGDPELAKRSEALERKLSKPVRRELEESYALLGEHADTPQQISDAVRTLMMRAGLCASADLGPALYQIFGRERDPARIQNDKWGHELLRFWLSPRCVTLLRALGMTP